MAYELHQEQPFPVGTYFFQVEPEGPIKIGRSSQIAKRYNVIAGAMPFPVKPRLIIPGDHERHLHYLFTDTWIHGEWFDPSESLESLMFTLERDSIDLLLCGPHRVPISKVVTKIEVGTIARGFINAEFPRNPVSRRNTRKEILLRYRKGLASDN